MDDKQKLQATHDILKRVRQLEIRTNRLLDTNLLGAYRSIFKGQGIEFEEVREYIEGDDIRSIDWNITARMHRPYVKKFREDRELTMMLAVDVSGSLDFGSAYYSKREVISEVASLLAFSATRNNDKVGLLLFSDGIEKFIPPVKGRKHVLRLIRELLFFQPGRRSTNIGSAMKYLNNVIHGHAIVFLLSDFIQPKIKNIRELTDALELTNRRHDLVCLQIEDRREKAIPGMGIVLFEDQESGELIEINTSSATFQKNYSANGARYRQALDTRLMRAGIDKLDIRTDANYLMELDQFLRKRARIK